jgi:hypothetical protein
MDPIEKQERKREAWRRLQAQRRRAGQLRGRVVAISLISFVLLWGIVFAQVTTGNDPVLGDKATVLSSARAEAHPAKMKPAQAAEAEPEPVTTSQS